jgi:hypothetical protein
MEVEPQDPSFAKVRGPPRRHEQILRRGLEEYTLSHPGNALDVSMSEFLPCQVGAILLDPSCSGSGMASSVERAYEPATGTDSPAGPQMSCHTATMFTHRLRSERRSSSKPANPSAEGVF